MSDTPIKPRVLVIGSINMDLVVHSSHMPAPGETVLGKDFATHPGGKGANQAVAAARLGADVVFLGRVGSDAFGLALRETFEAEGIPTEHLIETPGTPSGTATIIVDGLGENSIVVASGANFLLTPDDLFAREELFAAADVLLLQLEIPIPAVRAAIQLARRNDCQIILDPAPAIIDMPQMLFEVDIISPNASEAELLTGQGVRKDHGDKLIAADLIARGAKQAVLKLGSRGSMVLTASGEIHTIPPYKVEVVDTTAAGDTFTAALGVRVAMGDKLHHAAKYANAAAAIACTKHGAQQATPTPLEVQILMRDQG